MSRCYADAVVEHLGEGDHGRDSRTSRSGSVDWAELLGVGDDEAASSIAPRVSIRGELFSRVVLSFSLRAI